MSGPRLLGQCGATDGDGSYSAGYSSVQHWMGYGWVDVVAGFACRSWIFCFFKGRMGNMLILEQAYIPMFIPTGMLVVEKTL